MVKSINNNSNAVLVAGNTFTGVAESTQSKVEISVVMTADQNAIVTVEQSADGVTWDASASYNYVGGATKSYQVGVLHQYFRVKVTNVASVAMTYMRLNTYLNEEYSALKMTGSDGEGVVRSLLTDDQGKLQVSLTGTTGAPGLSAYQIAVEQGFAGSEAEWLASLKGADGTNGTNGSNGVDGTNGSNGADGADGTNGDPGLSAYQVWLVSNPGGSMEQYLNAIKGPGISVKGTLATEAMIFALDVGTLSVNDAWFAVDTKKLYVWSASSIWVDSGSLQGEEGVKGDKGDEGPALNVLGQLALMSDLPAGSVARNTAYFVVETNTLQVATGAGTWISSGSLKGSKGDQGVNFQFMGSFPSATITGLALTATDAGKVYLGSDTYFLYAWDGAAFVVSSSIRGPKGDKGDPGAPIVAKGQVALIADLTPLTATAVQGDMYVVLEDKRMYVYNGVGFIASGNSIEGPQGPQGIQGSVGSVGSTGASIQVISTVNTTNDLPTGYDAADIGKAHFISSLYTLVVWNGSAFTSSASLQGPLGLTGTSITVKGTLALIADLNTLNPAPVKGDAWFVSEDKNLYTYDGSAFQASGSLQGVQGNTGADITVKGTLALIADLNTLNPAPVKGDAWFVTEDKNLYVYDGSAFQASGSLQGAQGAQGYSFSFEGSDTSTNVTAYQQLFTAADAGRTYLESDTYKLNSWNGTNAVLSASIRGATGATGANINVKGNVSDLTALAAKVPTAVLGDAWFVLSDDTLNVFDGAAFQSSGSLTGPQGPAGALQEPTIITYQVASGVAGGAITATTWTQRQLNSLSGGAGANGGIALNANKIQFQSAGNYKVDFVGVVYDAGAHMVRLRNITTGFTLATGTGDVCSNGNSGHSHGVATITVAQNDEVELQHYIALAPANNMGSPVTSGENETYARVVIEKLA